MNGNAPHRTGQFLIVGGQEAAPSKAEGRLLRFFPDRVETLRDFERDFPEPRDSAPLLLARAIRAHYTARMFAQTAILTEHLLDWHGVDLPSWQYGAAAQCILQSTVEERIAEHEEIVRFCLEPDHLTLEHEPTVEQWSRRLAMARFNLADEYEEAGRIPEAVTEFERSLDGVKDPEMLVARLARLGCLYAKVGDWRSAHQRFHDSREVDPERHLRRLERLRPFYPELDLLADSGVSDGI